MKSSKAINNTEFDSESTAGFSNLPMYIPEMGNETGFNYQTVEIKSHSFSVRHPRHLAGENIIFEPGDFSSDAG